MRHRLHGGYLASLVGAVWGGAAGGICGAFLGTLYADRLGGPGYDVDPYSRFLGISAVILWAGAVAGCWLAQRRRHAGAIATAGILALTTLPTLLYLVRTAWYAVPGDGGDVGRLVAAFTALLVIAPLPSRFLARRLSGLLR